MDMQLVTVPLFDRDMKVQAYLFRYRKGCSLDQTGRAAAALDGASRSAPLEVLARAGLDALALGKPLFVPVTGVQLLGNLPAQCAEQPGQIIFRLDDLPPWEEPYLSRVAELLDRGFGLALNCPVDPGAHRLLLERCRYFFLPQDESRGVASHRLYPELTRRFPHLRLIATHIHNREMLTALQGQDYSLFEGRFFRIPVSEGNHTVSPLKANAVRLLNLVQNEDFEFNHVTRIIQGDPALTISLLRIVNARTGGSPEKIRTIPHAVALLGQREVRKWAATAVAKSLGEDRPGEITRIALVRARFAENLSPLFDQAHLAQGLFLMGLFSVLDLMLDVTMADALDAVQVSDPIRDALLSHKGMFYPALHLIARYEGADWSEVSRMMIVHDIPGDALPQAYLEALEWYRGVIGPLPAPEGEAGTPAGTAAGKGRCPDRRALTFGKKGLP